MKKLTSLMSVVLSLTSVTTQAQAPAKVSSLNVQGTTATFTLSTGKAHTPPACVNSDTRQLWSLDITSVQGRALYSLLLTAVSKSQLVVAHSANNCDVLAGIEQVAGLNVSFNDALPANSSGVALYKGDGVTKIGEVITVANGYITYHDKANSWYSIYSRNHSNAYLYFTSAECTGLVYGDNSDWLDRHNQGPIYSDVLQQYVVPTATSEPTNQLKSLGGSKVYRIGYGSTCQEAGSAYSFNASIVKLAPVEHPLCGQQPCALR